MRDMEPRIAVSPDEFFLLWWALDLGEPPTVLDVPRIGYTPEQRAAYAEEASVALRARDLGSVHEPRPELARLLHAIAAAPTTVVLRSYGASGTHRALGALGGKDAAVAARTGDQIRLGWTSRVALAGSMLGVLAPLVAGPGGSANVTKADFSRACAEGDLDGIAGFHRVLHAAGVRSTDASTLARAVVDREGGGQLGVTGRQVPDANPLTWLDTPAGRYALRQRGDWLTTTPAAMPRLVSMAADLLADLHPATTAAAVRDVRRVDHSGRP